MDRYEEALERAKKGLPIDEVSPELKESEDERIRTRLVALVEAFGQGKYKDEMLAYLEKQKEQKPVGWKPQPESLEALMYAIEGRWEMIKPTSYLSRRLEDLYEGIVNTFNVNEVYLEELPKVASTGDIEELKALKRKIDASMDEKPAGWSEEKIVNWLKENFYVSSFDNTKIVTKFSSMDDLIKSVRKRLKSLRPSWKPSEEQMKALNKVIHEVSMSLQLKDKLIHLEDELKKLM